MDSDIDLANEVDLEDENQRLQLEQDDIKVVKSLLKILWVNHVVRRVEY